MAFFAGYVLRILPMGLSPWQQGRWNEIEPELKKIVARLAASGALRVVLYGSYARGDFHADSDIDLLILKETNERFIDRIASALAVTGACIPVEPVVYTPEEIEQMHARRSGLLAEAEREGKVLYERSA
jgi:predicted nucleotidyltransferase